MNTQEERKQTMSKQELSIIKALYQEAFDAYDPNNSDHQHLSEALQDAGELLHKYEALDDGQYAIYCEALGG